MKKTILSTLVAVGLISSASAQVYFTDNFAGYSVNTNNWNVTLPQGNSAVTQNNGSLTLTDGGTITSTASFSNPLTISGSFTMDDSRDLLAIYDRSSGQLTDGLGLYIRGTVEAGSGAEVTLNEQLPNNPATVLASVYMPINANQTYSYVIQDNGSSYSLNLDGANIFTASLDPSFTEGNKVQFGDGEWGGGGLGITTTLSPVSITAAPEPSTYALFGLGALALVIAYRRKVA